MRCGFELDQLQQLRGRNLKGFGRRRQLVVAAFHRVQSFSEQGGEILVTGIDYHPLVMAARLPQSAGLLWGAFAANMHGEVQTKAAQGPVKVLVLAATLAGLGGYARGLMRKAHGGLGLVAVLATGTGGARALNVTLAQQGFGIKVGGMGWWCGVRHKRIVAVMSGKREKLWHRRLA